MHTSVLKRSFWCYIIKLICVSAGVYLSFRFLLPLFLPFLLAYLVIYLLTPAMNYLNEHTRLPKRVADYGLLTLSIVIFFAVFSLLLWKIMEQFHLLFSNFPVYKQLLSELCQKHYLSACKCMDKFFFFFLGTTTAFLSKQLQGLGEKYHLLLSEKAGKTLLSCLGSSIQLFAFTGFFIISMFILVSEMKPLRETIRKSRHYPSFHLIYENMKKSGFTYLKTEFLILGLNWLLCSLGIFFLHNPYFFLLGAIIALLDALPVIGSGLVLIPWSIFSFLKNDYTAAVILLLTFLITLFVREILEAKLLGKGMGINPFLMLFSIYAGIRLFGACGILFGPLSIVLIQTLMAEEPAAGTESVSRS